MKIDVTRPLYDFSLDRIVNAVERVRDRLNRATIALANAKILYAVVGGNAVAAWVSRVDEAAVRNTQDVDLLLRREDLEQAKLALGAAGFFFRHVKGIDLFLDGPDAKARDAVHIVFANEFIRADYPTASPSMDEVDNSGPFTVVSLESLVRMKLTSYRDKDRTHLRDLLDVGLVDDSWLAQFSELLAERLRHIIETPDG